MNNEEKVVINVETFDPANSGDLNRSINKEPVKGDSASALAQATGVKVSPILANPNAPVYSGQVDFPQPFVSGLGRVTSAGAKGSSFLSDRWSVVRNTTGIYTLTHNIGNNNYIVMLTLEDIGNPRYCTLDTPTSTQFVVRTFNNSGTAADTAFHFIVYSI